MKNRYQSTSSKISVLYEPFATKGGQKLPFTAFYKITHNLVYIIAPDQFLKTYSTRTRLNHS